MEASAEVIQVLAQQGRMIVSHPLRLCLDFRSDLWCEHHSDQAQAPLVAVAVAQLPAVVVLIRIPIIRS